MLKRDYYSTNHQRSDKHILKYVQEFSQRYTIRSLNTIDQIPSISMGKEEKRLRNHDMAR